MAPKAQLNREGSASHHWLADSWQRSLGAGLSETRSPQELRLNADDLQYKREEHQQLISLVQTHALPLFNQLMAHSSSRLILSDRDGFVLCHWGVSQYSDKLANVALDIGVNWQEQHKGTNAIGTALTAKQAISVVGEQHFIVQHRFMSCTACPIFAPNGDMLGAIDITSEQQRHTQQTLLLVSSLAQQIETALLCHLPESHYRIDVAAAPHLINSGWQGILVADSDGRIVGCNPMAKQLLERAKVGDSIEHYLGTDWLRSGAAPHLNLHVQTQALKSHRSVLVSQLGVRFRDPKLERAWQQAKKVLSKQIPLLILGETGVGKEQFVKQLHAQSARHQQPLVAVNCAALPSELVESELFGYQAGAFTGANRTGYLGKIRQANGGILFLDEIGEMPLAAQSRLLRVLQEREVTPIGSNQSYKVDIQVVAATHMDLAQRVALGHFRQDLYYRLNGLQVNLPSLRERSDKERIIHKLHHRYRAANQVLCPDLLAQLLTYAWPGNLRELDNLMQVACLLSDTDSVLTWSHLPEHLQQLLGAPASVAANLTDDSIVAMRHASGAQRCDVTSRDAALHGAMSHDATTHEAMTHKSMASFRHPNAEIEACQSTAPSVALHATINANVAAMYTACNGNVSECAKRLGISRNTLYRKLKALGIKS